MMRINKYLKDKGLTTRRGADELIESGSVYVNGKKAVLGQDVNSKDIIEIKNVSGIKEEKLYYIAYNKPIGILTNNDEAGDKDILSVTNFKDENNKNIKVFPVGRLDKDSHGLILITNDGRITDKLLSPRFKHEKEYMVTVDKPYNDLFLSRMESGIRMDGSVTRECKTERLTPNSFKIILTEGKKRQIRRMCEALHYGVVDLYRSRIMNINIDRLPDGEYRHLNTTEKKVLLALLYVPMKESLKMAKVRIPIKPKTSSLPPHVEPKAKPFAPRTSRESNKKNSRTRSKSARRRTK